VVFTLAGVANRHFGFIDARPAAFAIMVVLTLGYLHYAVDVVGALCHTLHIRVFTIKVHAA
jgi:hypothetical protein